MITKMNVETLKDIHSFGTTAHLTNPNKIYCYLPYWIEIVDINEGTCILHSLEKSPQDLKDFLREQRQEQPIGYLLNDRFYKSLDELRGFTTALDEQPIPLYK